MSPGEPPVLEFDGRPTLDIALANASLAGDRGTRRPDTPLDRAANRGDILPFDLWIGHATDTIFKPLNIAEIETINIAHVKQTPVETLPEQQTIIVTGRRYDYNPAVGAYQFGGHENWSYSSEQPTPNPDAMAEELECQSTDGMSDEKLRDYQISEEAAKIAREILAAANHDSIEYASLIYRDANGVIRHTTIAPGGPTSSTPGFEGIQNWGQVLAIVHSHTAATYNAGNPLLKLFPTPNNAEPSGHGDWWSFDQMAGFIQDSLESDYGMTEQEALNQSRVFRQYVLGPTGISGTNSYDLRGYAFDDRDLYTLGQNISKNLGLCS